MAEILDQDEIDKLKSRLDSITNLKELASIAKAKISTMYMDVCKMQMKNNLDTLEDIGDAIEDIGQYIRYDSKYADSFFRLRSSHLERLTR